MRPSLKLLTSYILAVLTMLVLVEFILPTTVGLFLFMFVIAGFPFWLFIIGVQALSEMK